MFEATLKNRISAHFAPVTITFPIPEDQYEQAILALEKSQIGDARVQDCLIDNVHAPNCPALVRMTGTMANVDELDWLGKQLESFDRYELLQFNAAVERFGLEIRRNKDNALIANAFELAAGKSISTLTLLEIPEFGNVDCTVTITAFRDGKQIGSMRTELVLHTAYLWPKEVQ